MQKSTPLNLQAWAAQSWVGESWEGWVIEQIISTRSALGHAFKAWYFRTNDGLECDLIIESGGLREVIEIKLATTPDSGDFRKLEKIALLVKADRQVMITRVADEHTVTSGDRWSVNLATYLAQFTPRPSLDVLPPHLRLQQEHSVDRLLEKLKEAAGAMHGTDLSPERLKQRAVWLHKDLQTLAWENFKVLPTHLVQIPGIGLIPTVEYTWGQDQYSVHKASLGHTKLTAEQASGLGLDRENLGWLGRISELGHTLIPHLWLNDARLRHDVAERNQHLDTLNEVWWLSRWQGIDCKSIQREYRLHPKNNSTIDWRFDILHTGLSINLSVKNRKGTSTSKLHGRRVLLLDNTYALPFSQSNENELNVIAITGYHGGILTAEEQRAEATAFLNQYPEVDAVVVWIRCTVGRPSPNTLLDGMHLYFPTNRGLDRKDQILSVVCKQQVDDEDAAVVGFLQHTLSLDQLWDLAENE